MSIPIAKARITIASAPCSYGAFELTAIVVILPVVRIERMTETPTDGFAPDSNSASRRKRRRRGSRT